MATNSKTTTSSAQSDMADIGNQITSNLAAADDIAAQRVQTLAWVHQARAAQLSRTATSLKAQYGPNDPGVKSAEAAVAAANATAAQVAMVHHQLTTADPQVAPIGWALHGRVFNAQLAPVSGYTVFVVDSAKNYQEAYGFAYTDHTGYFLLNYPGPDAASGRTPAAASGQTPSEAAPQSATPGPGPGGLTPRYRPPTIRSRCGREIGRLPESARCGPSRGDRRNGGRIPQSKEH